MSGHPSNTNGCRPKNQGGGLAKRYEETGLSLAACWFRHPPWVAGAQFMRASTQVLSSCIGLEHASGGHTQPSPIRRPYQIITLTALSAKIFFTFRTEQERDRLLAEVESLAADLILEMDFGFYSIWWRYYTCTAKMTIFRCMECCSSTGHVSYMPLHGDGNGKRA